MRRNIDSAAYFVTITIMAERLSRFAKDWRVRAAGFGLLGLLGAGGVAHERIAIDASNQHREQAITAQLDYKYTDYSKQTIEGAKRTVTIFQRDVAAAEQRAFATRGSILRVSISPAVQKAERIVEVADARQKADAQLEKKYPKIEETPLEDISLAAGVVGLGGGFVTFGRTPLGRRIFDNDKKNSRRISS